MIYIYISNGLNRTRRIDNGWIDKKEYLLMWCAETKKRERKGTVFIVLKRLDPV